MKNTFLWVFRARDEPKTTDSVSAEQLFYFGISEAGKSVTVKNGHTGIERTVYAYTQVITVTGLPLHMSACFGAHSNGCRAKESDAFSGGRHGALSVAEAFLFIQSNRKTHIRYGE